MTATASWWGALAGLGLATGVLLIVAGLPWTRQVSLDQRVQPYLDARPRRSRLIFGEESREWQASDVLAPLARRVARWLDRLLGGAESVRSRQRRAGLAEDLDAFRLQQALWGTLGAAGAVAFGVAVWWLRGASVPAVAVVVGAAFLSGAVARDLVLTRAAERRERQMLLEFPAVAELLALSVTAGEGTAQALERVARVSRGELAAELDLCLAQARTGASLQEALQGMGRRTGLAPVIRFVDGLVVALQRGTPLGDVLRAQAADAREAARQSLIEQGGRKETSMMIPVVFLVLPVTVLFAVFPGVSLLRIAV